MVDAPMMSTEIILPLLQLIALTLPVIAILGQVMVRVNITEQQSEPSRLADFSILFVGVSALLLISAAINLISILLESVNAELVSQALNTLIIAFFLLVLAILTTLLEFRDLIRSGERNKDDETQSSLQEWSSEASTNNEHE